MPRRLPDITYACTDGMWTRFYPETPDGDAAYTVMARADKDGVVAFLAPQVPGVLAQLRKAGLIVKRAKPAKRISEAELGALLAELA
jgi:hypothetical protein